MDIRAITFPTAINLTHTHLETEFGVITGHQINRADFAQGFAWGVDIDMSGFGFTGVRHINGNVAFADQFGAGNNSAAIQAAVNWVSGTSPGRGIVYVPALSTAWTFNSTVTVPDGIQIIGLGWPILSKTSSSTMFQLGSGGSGADDVEIAGLVIRGGGNPGDFVSASSGFSRKIVIHHNIFGDRTHTAGLRMMGGGYTISLGGTSIGEDIFVHDNLGVRHTQLANLLNCNRVMIHNNTLYPDTASTDTFAEAISLNDVQNFSVIGNQFINDGGLSPTTNGWSIGIRLRGASPGAASMGEIVENYILGGSSHCLSIEDDSNHITVEGNTFLAAGWPSAGGTGVIADGINISGNANHIQVRNNVSTRPLDAQLASSTSQFHRYGINITAGTVADVVIEGNFFENIGTVAGTSSATHHVCGNLGALAGAGIKITGSPTRVTIRNNQVIERHIVTYTTDNTDDGGPSAHTEFVTVNGMRIAGTDADRQAQYLGMVVDHANLGTAVAIPAAGIGVEGATANDRVELGFSAPPTAGKRVLLQLHC